MSARWNKMTNREKFLFILRLIISAVIVLLAVLKLAGSFENALYYSTPLMGVLLVVQAVQEWKEQRGMAIFGLCAALFIFICTIAVLIL